LVASAVKRRNQLATLSVIVVISLMISAACAVLFT
jgi:hypothetical protein